MPFTQRHRFVLAAVFFALAYGHAMKVLLGLSTVAPIIVTVVLAAGTAIAFNRVKREAKLEGAKPVPDKADGVALRELVIGKVVATTLVLAIIGAFQLTPAAGVAVIMLIIFGFMIAMVLTFVFARIEVRTRAELAAPA